MRAFVKSAAARILASCVALDTFRASLVRFIEFSADRVNGTRNAAVVTTTAAYAMSSTSVKPGDESSTNARSRRRVKRDADMCLWATRERRVAPGGGGARTVPVETARNRLEILGNQDVTILAAAAARGPRHRSCQAPDKTRATGRATMSYPRAPVMMASMTVPAGKADGSHSSR